MAEKQSPEISLDPPERDGKKSAADPERQADHVDPKRDRSFAETVQDAKERAAGV